MNSVEERLREALRAHAEDFQGHPDAWQHLQARNRARLARRRQARDWPTRFVIPAAAAAAVVAIAVAASLIVNGVSGSSGSPASPGSSGRARSAGATQGGGLVTPTPSPTAPGPYAPSGPATEMLLVDPPTSAVIGLRVPWTGPKAGQVVMSYFWLGYNSPAHWQDQVVPGPQFCNDTVNVSTGESGGFCWPLPQLGAGHLAQVTGREGVGTNQAIGVGAAAAQVTSVTAVLPDGRTFAGVVKTGRGLADKPWTVGYPLAKGVRLVFRNAAGNQVATLGTAGPIGPPQFPQPRRGGVTVFRYPGNHGLPAGNVVAYLVEGRVGFWSPFSGGLICPVPANGQPALGGIALSFGDNGSHTKAFGYAHADVARVVLRFAGGHASTGTLVAGWTGSDVRLWAVSLPDRVGHQQPPTAVTATAYDAAGHVVGQVQLGQME